MGDKNEDETTSWVSSSENKKRIASIRRNKTQTMNKKKHTHTSKNKKSKSNEDIRAAPKWRGSR
jgi:hypothetical protein